MPGPRRRSREIALQVLYQIDANPGLAPDEALRLYFEHLGPGDDAGEPDDRAFTETLVRGVEAHRAEVDAAIARLSRSWRIERMAVVDRNLLRLGLFELVHLPDIPAAVTLDECVEIGRRFGADEAGAFVNGLLDRARVELGIAKP